MKMECRKLKAVLFDMDGVLFDSMKNHASSWAAAVSQHGLQMDAAEAYLHEGRTGGGTIDILARRHWGRPATEAEKEAIYATKSALFNRCPEALPMPGAAEVLRKTGEAGLLPVLVTGSGQKSLLERLNQAYPGVFVPERMVTSFDVTQGKPHPEPYLMGLRKAGIRAEECFVVENAPLGIQAAVAAGCYTVAVNTGPLPDSVLLEAGADRLYASMQALAEGFEALVGELECNN